MNLRHIEILCAVMRCRTTIAAAYELGISQPAISSAIKHLEAQIGMQLFQRAGNRLVPTSEAQAIYRDAEPLHAMSQAISRKIVDMRDTKRGHLRIMTTHALMRSVAARAVAHFVRNRNDVQVFFDVRRMEGVIESVESGFADLGFALAPPPRPGIHVEVVTSGEMVVALQHDHPLAKRPHLTPSDLSDAVLIGLEPSSRLGVLIRQCCEEAGSAYSPVIEVRHCTTACTLVEQGVGIAIIDSFTADKANAWNVAIRPFVPRLVVPACILYLQERQLSRLSHRFIQTLLKHVDDPFQPSS